MAISLTRFSWSLWGDRRKEKEPIFNASAFHSSSSSEKGLEVMKKTKMGPPHKRVKRKKEKTRVDREFDDAVLVASDDGNDWCLSGSESDDSDWSIGWFEPLGSGFESDDDFAVLVPCYTPGREEVGASNNVLLSVIKNLSDESSSTEKNYMEQWLNSLQNFEALKETPTSCEPL